MPAFNKTPELLNEIVERISNGEPLRAICRDDHMPSWSSVYAWISADADFASRIARARDLGADAIAEEALAILDESPERCGTQFGDKVDAGYVAWQKNRVEQRLKLLAKWSPKKYGDSAKVELSGHLAVGNMSEDEMRAELAALAASGVIPLSADDDVSDLV